MFGLLRQRKLDFLDIYSEEMIIAAKAIVAQVRLQSLNCTYELVSEQFTKKTLFVLQCVADSVVHIEEIDTEVVTK